MDFFESHKLSLKDNACFICGVRLTQKNKTDEHVFPKWLQKEFDLWNNNVILLNNTTLQYRKLTVPCCKACNHIMSEKIEKPMSIAIKKGYENIIEIDEDIVFNWLNKIAYGIIYKESLLRLNIKDNVSNSIYPKSLLETHDMQHLFLKSFIENIEVINKPYSLMFLKIEESREFWFYNNPSNQDFFIKINNIGIIAHLMDNGYLSGFLLENNSPKERFEEKITLFDFIDLSARMHYKNSLWYRVPNYHVAMNLSSKKIEHIYCFPCDGQGYYNWNNEDAAKMIITFFRDYNLKLEDVYDKEKDSLLNYELINT